MTTLITSDESDSSLKTATGYSKSANLLMKYIGRTRSADVLASAIVLRSLALEIYLKHLYVMDHHKSYEGHHLKQIFDALSEETRRRIMEYYDRSLAESSFIRQILTKHHEIKGAVPQLDLEHVLHEWSEAVTEWRYFFEPRNKVVFLAFGEVEKALSHALGNVSPGMESGSGPAQESAA